MICLYIMLYVRHVIYKSCYIHFMLYTLHVIYTSCYMYVMLYTRDVKCKRLRYVRLQIEKYRLRQNSMSCIIDWKN